MGVVFVKMVCVMCFLDVSYRFMMHEAFPAQELVGHCSFQCRRVGLKMASVCKCSNFKATSCDAAQKMNDSHCFVEGIHRMFGSSPSENHHGVIYELYAVKLCEISVYMKDVGFGMCPVCYFGDGLEAGSPRNWDFFPG